MKPLAAESRVCGYAVCQILSQKPQGTWLCQDSRGRQLVLKRLEQDCLIGGDLHPEIRERLARVRELPHRSVATLMGVERDSDGAVYCVWEYLEGTPFEAFLADGGRDGGRAARLLRELALAIEGMHAHGIVHGAIHSGNVIVNAAGEVRLLDVSPLLFDDPMEDTRAMGAMARRILDARGESDTRIGQELLAQIEAGADIRSLSTAISRATHATSSSGQAASSEQAVEDRVRSKALRLAAIVAGAAALLAAILLWSFSESRKAPPTASREAMEARP